MPDKFESLALKTLVVATNYLDRNEMVYRSGPLKPAVAGSMAISGLFRPVEYHGSVLIDGGAVNPLPYDMLFECADIVVAVDVTFGGRARSRHMPSPLESMFGAAQIMQGAITEEKIRRRPPDVLIRPKVEQFGLLDFFRAGQLLRGAEESKEELKSALHAQMKTFRAA